MFEGGAMVDDNTYRGPPTTLSSAKYGDSRNLTVQILQLREGVPDDGG